MGDISTPLASLNCKIEQGVDTLKSFIYLTNEYGVPSVSYIDDFINNFGHDIVTGQFRYSKLDGFWETVKDDCEKNKVQYKEVYGSLFYELVTKYLQVVTKGWSEEEKKDLISSENDRLDLLKDFISNFDKYISEGLDMQEVYLENTPELIKKDENGDEYIEIHHTRGIVDAHGRLYRNKVVVLKDSKLRELGDPNIYNQTSAQSLNERKGKVNELTLLEDVEFQSPSGAAVFVEGRASNGWDRRRGWVNSRGQEINYYRVKRYSENIQVQNVDPDNVEPIKVVQNEISVEPVKLVENTVKKIDDTVKVEYGASIRVYLDNSKRLVMTDADTGVKYVHVHTTLQGNKAFGRFYENGYLLLLKGSICREPYGTVLKDETGDRLVDLYNKYTTNGVLNRNIYFKSFALASYFVMGTFTDNGWNLWLNDNNDSIRVYKDPLKTPITAYKTPVTSAKIPRYKLKAQYSSKGSQSLMGRELKLDGKPFGLIIGDTQAKIDGKAYDLSIYIYKNKIDINRLRIFVAPFLDAYELEED